MSALVAPPTAPFMTRGESRRLLLMSAGLVLCLAWIEGAATRHRSLPPSGTRPSGFAAGSPLSTRDLAPPAPAAPASPAWVGSPEPLDLARLAAQDDRAVDVLDGPALRHLALVARSSPAPDLAAEPALAWSELCAPGGAADLEALARARGRPVRCEGQLVTPFVERALLDDQRVWQAVAREGKRGWFVTLAEPPPPGATTGSTIAVTGRLLGLQRYRPGRGPLVELPHLVARAATPLAAAPPPERRAELPDLLLVALVGVSALCMGVYVAVSRRGDARHDRWRREALRRPS